MQQQNELYQQTIEQLRKQTNPLDYIIGTSQAIQQIKSTIAIFANSGLSILLTGETGVGKEVFANALHQLSSRSTSNFVKINCAAIPKDLLESELFGYEGGAFTGAKKGGKIGKFELADGGTLLLEKSVRCRFRAVKAFTCTSGKGSRTHRRCHPHQSGCPPHLQHEPESDAADSGRTFPCRSLLSY